MRKLKILAGGAEPLFSDLKRTALEFWGCDVITIADGKEACAALLTEEIDLCFLDWNMAKMTGLEVCLWLRQADFNKQPRVILLTERDRPEQISAAYLAGANDYVTKPFSLEDFHFLVSTAAQSLSLKQTAHREFVMMDPLEQYRRDLTAATKICSGT